MADYYVAPKESFDATADAIREKTGSQAEIEWTNEGFADAIGELKGSDAISVDEMANLSKPSGPITLTGTTVNGYAFYNRDGITDIVGENITAIGTYAFYHCNGLERVFLPSWQGSSTSNNYIFSYAGTMAKTIIVLPSLVNFGSRMFNRGGFKAVDIGPNSTGTMGADTFYHNTGNQIVGDLILRRSDAIVSASTTDAINGLRDVWVPSDLITTYQEASNWSTRYTGGYITFHAIENSQYENYYADGTAIPSAS